jgi:hypothetical protein
MMITTILPFAEEGYVAGKNTNYTATRPIMMLFHGQLCTKASHVTLGTAMSTVIPSACLQTTLAS